LDSGFLIGGWPLDAEIGRAATRTVPNQQLMSDQNRLCDDGAYSSRLGKANNRCDEMDDGNEQITITDGTTDEFRVICALNYNSSGSRYEHFES
jgi:hypothetical protein